MNENKTNINWYPGHMAKTRREIKEKLNLIDVVYEVIDARIPFSSRIENINELIKNKPHILIMSKCDLSDEQETKNWLKYYENKKINVLAVNLTNNKDYLKIVKLTQELMNNINLKRKKRGLNSKEAKVLVLGIPNVGKSTLINQMATKKVAGVANKPGVTKNLTWLKTKYNILLLDTPGILAPNIKDEEVGLNLASMTAIKDSILPKDKVAIHILNKLNKHYPDILKSRYKIDNLDSDIETVYENIGRNLGIIKTGNEVDYDKVSEYIINDLKNNIKGITFDQR